MRLKGFVLLLAAPFVLSSCEKIKAFMGQADSVKLESEEEKASYLLGYILAENTKKSEAHLVSQAFLKGAQDSLNGQKPMLEQRDMESVHRQIKKKAALEKRKREGEKHKMSGQKFLEENKNKEGVQVTASGLQYEVLTEGPGKKPAKEDTVEVHYRGTLIDGTEFDSSYKRGVSASFPLQAVIKGWTEGLALMKEGSKYKFYIPSHLAYGERGSGSNVPPHAVLIFEVELIKIK